MHGGLDTRQAGGMTMLYRCDADAAAIAVRFGALAGADPWAGGTIAPGQFAPVVTADREFIAGPRGERQPRRCGPRGCWPNCRSCG